MATVLALMELHALEGGFQYDAVVLTRPDVWLHVETDLPRQAMSLFEYCFYERHRSTFSLMYIRTD